MNEIKEPFRKTKRTQVEFYEDDLKKLQEIRKLLRKDWKKFFEVLVQLADSLDSDPAIENRLREKLKSIEE